MAWKDDIVYVNILVFSFACSYLIKRLPCRHRASISALLGLLVIYVVCGLQLFYSLAMVLINIVIVKLLPGLPILSLLYCFAYLAFYRCAHLICDGGMFPKVLPHGNAVQLIVTLRCVGLAFEISDDRKTKETDDPNRRRSDNLVADPLQMFYYCYNLFGLFTGPYYTYRVHQDMVTCTFLQQIPIGVEVVSRFLVLPVPFVLYLVLQAICPYEYAHTDSFYQTNSFLARLLYSVPVFAAVRCRFYVAWMLSEASCMATGIGAYPKVSKPRIGAGPSDIPKYKKAIETYVNPGAVDASNVQPSLMFDYETIRNVDVYGCEFGHTFRDCMKSWNRSVQYWLAAYIYQRCPWKSIRTSLTLLISAYWHGLYAGYYLSFLMMPLCVYAEDILFSVFDNVGTRGWKIGGNQLQLAWWFFRMRLSDYLIMGFVLLSWTSAMRYWSSVYYAFHIVLVTVVCASLLLKRFAHPKKS